MCNSRLRCQVFIDSFSVEKTYLFNIYQLKHLDIKAIFNYNSLRVTAVTKTHSQVLILSLQFVVGNSSFSGEQLSTLLKSAGKIIKKYSKVKKKKTRMTSNIFLFYEFIFFDFFKKHYLIKPRKG